MDPLALPLEVLPKALTYAAVMLAVGACVARGLFRLRVGSLSSEAAAEFQPALGHLVRRVAIFLIAALMWRAWGHTAVAFGLGESFAWESLKTIAWESQWGAGWQAQMAGALALAAVVQSLNDWPKAGWALTALTAVVLCFLMPRLGHAAGEPDRMLLHGAHVLGAGVWLGTLGAIVLATSVFSQSASALLLRNRLLSRFSPVAFTGAGLLVATGLVAVWLYVGSLDRLVTTTYGRLLMLKLFLVSDVATFGFLNWQRLRSSADGRAAPDRQAFVILEVALAVAVVLVTAMLTETEHP